MQRSGLRMARVVAAAIVVFSLAAALAPVGVGAKPKNDCRRFVPGADLSKCDLRGLYLSGLDLSGADLSKARLDGADMSDALLIGADLTKVSAIGVSFFHANLREAIVTKANFTASTFENADMIDISGGGSADFDDVVCVDGSPAVNGACPPPAPNVLDVRVEDTSANPLTGIRVELREVGDPNANGTANELVGIECSTSGEADFSGVGDGSYKITASDSGPGCSAADLYEETIDTVVYSYYADLGDGAIDDSITGSGVFAGSPDALIALSLVVTNGVLDVFVHGTDTDQPLDGILVTLESEDETLFQWDCTEGGVAEFFVPDGYYTIVATDSAIDPAYSCGKAGVYGTSIATFVYSIADDALDGEIDDDITTVGVNFDMGIALSPLQQVGILDVAIADEHTGEPLSGMIVTLMDDASDEIVDIECSVDGEAQFQVPAGDYSVLVASSDGDDTCGALVEYEASVVNADYSIVADLEDDDALDDDIPLWFIAPNGGDATPDVIVNLERVTLLDVFVQDPLLDIPLENILIFLYDQVGDPIGAECTDASGTAGFAVPSGTYTIEATDSETTGAYGCGTAGRYETTILEDYNYSIDDDAGDGADVSLQMDLVLGMLNVLVQDTVTDEPLSGIWVDLYTADHQTLLDSECSTDGQAFFSVTNGNYVLETRVSNGNDGCISPAQQFDPENDTITYSILDDAQDGYVFDDLSAENGSPDHILNLQPLS